jgi:hypothetical protein
MTGHKRNEVKTKELGIGCMNTMIKKHSKGMVKIFGKNTLIPSPETATSIETKKEGDTRNR